MLNSIRIEQKKITILIKASIEFFKRKQNQEEEDARQGGERSETLRRRLPPFKRILIGNEFFCLESTTPIFVEILYYYYHPVWEGELIIKLASSPEIQIQKDFFILL